DLRDVDDGGAQVDRADHGVGHRGHVTDKLLKTLPAPSDGIDPRASILGERSVQDGHAARRVGDLPEVVITNSRIVIGTAARMGDI
ncbi:hypothetical protein, partial [Tsukamurella paurometabola]